MSIEMEEVAITVVISGVYASVNGGSRFDKFYL
jgi:hypothetical protein